MSTLQENLKEPNIGLGIKEALQTEFMTTIREERRLAAETLENEKKETTGFFVDPGI